MTEAERLALAGPAPAPAVTPFRVLDSIKSEDDLEAYVQARIAEEAAPAERGEYPPLPEPARRQGQQMSYDGDDKAFFDCFSADQMRAYVDADRAQRVPLTDEQIDEIVCANAGYGRDDFRSCARAVERAHGIGAKP